MLTSAQKQRSVPSLAQADFPQLSHGKELFLSHVLTKFLWNPVKAKGELLNLDDEVVGE